MLLQRLLVLPLPLLLWIPFEWNRTVRAEKTSINACMIMINHQCSTIHSFFVWMANMNTSRRQPSDTQAKTYRHCTQNHSVSIGSPCMCACVFWNLIESLAMLVFNFVRSLAHSPYFSHIFLFLLFLLMVMTSISRATIFCFECSKCKKMVRWQAFILHSYSTRNEESKRDEKETTALMTPASRRVYDRLSANEKTKRSWMKTGSFRLFIETESTG